MAGKLFVVATPIGNLGDITARAAETLRTCARVVAEDTRRTRALLAHLGVEGKPIERVDAHASEGTIAKIVARMEGGEDVALVTDAGTPVVSDPGADLVAAAIDARCEVVPIPGASAVVAALSASGLATNAFRFVGFLPRSGPDRRAALETIRATAEPVVLYESAERMEETLGDLAALAPERRVAVARELTKMHEEFVRGAAKELAEEKRAWVGEITIVLGEAPREEARAIDDAEIDRRIDEELAKGARAKDAAEAVALALGLSKRDLYARAVARKRGR